jgi:hypothetical protein
MFGKIIDKDGTITIEVRFGGELWHYPTFLNSVSFAGVYPQNIGENATNATGIKDMWQGESGMFYHVTGEKEVVMVKVVEEKPDKPKTEKTKPLPPPPEVEEKLKSDPEPEPAEDIAVSLMGEEPEAEPEKEPEPPKPKTRGRQTRKKRVK